MEDKKQMPRKLSREEIKALQKQYGIGYRKKLPDGRYESLTKYGIVIININQKVQFFVNTLSLFFGITVFPLVWQFKSLDKQGLPIPLWLWVSLSLSLSLLIFIITFTNYYVTKQLKQQ